ncbi:MAG: hypothetical protein Hyperionvirus1_115 [Hyperionvirus sp.]|uniref:Uncharacterized protein n=1 Tax=Hyperionvirus sp. TaxID=2487770 RepID=A0A3G5A5L9_9VIRU|nr:MAG: hypothetical protein Hyperionvirus1_115 [Hyperionvirus sp.]
MSFEGKETKLAEEWKDYFVWNEGTHRIVHGKMWYDGYLFSVIFEHDPKIKEGCEYLRMLERKQADFAERVENFKVRTEVKTFEDMTADEVILLEAKWSGKGLMWHVSPENDPESAFNRNIIEKWLATVKDPAATRKEVMLLKDILYAQKHPEDKINKEINEMVERLGSMLDGSITISGSNAEVFAALKKRHQKAE